MCLNITTHLILVRTLRCCEARKITKNMYYHKIMTTKIILTATMTMATSIVNHRHYHHEHYCHFHRKTLHHLLGWRCSNRITLENVFFFSSLWKKYWAQKFAFAKIFHTNVLFLCLGKGRKIIICIFGNFRWALVSSILYITHLHKLRVFENRSRKKNAQEQ